MKNACLIFFLFYFLSNALLAQTPTIGLVHNDGNVSPGYVLFTPESNNDVFLIDECGELINQWTFSQRPGLTCYLLENGNLLRVGLDSLEIRDWDNNLVWSYAVTTNGILKHHDIEPLPNGNILLVARDIYTEAEVLAMGGDPLLSTQGRNFEKVIELQPVGTNQANVVWEWKFKDHLIQDYDVNKPNYGVIGNHPELLNMNYDNDQDVDMVHLNGIDYNAELDQIMVTARHLSELYIIDHSTTTLEAASHTGGDSGKGGDFLWRWGNADVYQPGLNIPQKIFLPHDGKWVNKTYADSGKISVFNNRGDGSNTASSIHLIEPIISNGDYQLGALGFAPTDFDWSWTDDILGTVFYESKKSGTHALPNGNMILCEESKGRITEVTKSGDVIWVYVCPSGTAIGAQYSTPSSVSNYIFRAEKYPSDFIGFTGKDLTSSGIIENINNVSDECIAGLGLSEIEKVEPLFVQPAVQGDIQFYMTHHFTELKIVDVQGKIVFRMDDFHGDVIQTNLDEGMYYLFVQEEGQQFTYKLLNIE